MSRKASTRHVAEQETDALSGDDLGRRFTRLAGVITELRARCPWTAALTHQSLLEYLIEEAYEVVETVEAGHTGVSDAAEFSGELGDVLFQVLLHARLQEEAGHFGIGEVLDALTAKMIRRNPHVFAPDGSLRAATTDDPAEIERAWDEVKKQEKPERTSPLDGIPAGLPALLLAAKALDRARRAGISVPPLSEPPSDPHPQTGGPAPAWRTGEELGDHLFDVVRQAQEQGLDAEAALRAAVRRFSTRLDGSGTLPAGPQGF
ncbi:nucleotide pyrophosphohydrolase [Arthrobacter jiangjiafuii]|uniref:Nucleotide pyrophosphohydrolase n=1 Tax=Arthrobacter jiangjiafuii TaxID=2817475 RepID=A0A975M6U8_9MICC|nr:MazG nucleotide pyrophosphohydrolase domain-containing protein [Arthrobacter jiangjiafuii]MBP3043881.1 nucleotide pyrophosphohydrolase [Arthrobacter jiangjiafuii]QWC10890.1 nucleotide pyrophosphohydrolase [Arthrobacter jiangjiafuii]